MNSRPLLFLFFALAILLLPALSLLPAAGERAAPLETSAPALPPEYEGEPLLIYDKAAGKIIEMSEYDYVVGALLAEMPYTWPEEALKAQAVAIHTSALAAKRMAADGKAADGYFSIDTETGSGFMTAERRNSFYGADSKLALAAAESAAGAVIRDILTYGGEPINALWFSISCGKTESSENVFGSYLPYLVPVESKWDTEADGYLSEKTLTASELEDQLRAFNPAFAASSSPASWLGETVKSESGTVLRQTICGREFSGAEIRKALFLRSAAFDVSFDGENASFLFTVRGYGHNVGLSQYGARGMALDGADHMDILAHYYTDSVYTRLE